VQQLLERGLADHAEPERGERDPELACGQVRVDVVRRRGAPTARRHCHGRRKSFPGVVRQSRAAASVA
jgi:hypothetical protein